MATGYDRREATRGSFAFAPRQGRQTRNDAAATPTIGRSGVTGGTNTGGGNVIMSENPVSGSGAGAAIPAFLEEALEPVIKAAQERSVREGYTAAANGVAMEEIARRQPGLSSIFGPTDFQRGAQFFATQAAVSDWQAEQLNNMDTLRQLPEEDLPRYLDDAAMNHMTGDVFADNAIGAALMEATTTLIPRIAQARVEWQQNTLRQGYVRNTTAAGGAYAALVQSYTSQPELVEGQEDPLAGTRINDEAIAAGREQFLSSLMPIDGMSNDAWKAGLEQTARGLLADGNLWAYNALTEEGSNGPLFQLDPEKQASLEAAYRSAGKSAQARALMQVGPEYDLFRTQVRLGQIPADEVRERLNQFNVRIAVLSGYTEPYFDAEAMISQTEGVVDDLVTNYERDENRAYTEHRDEENRRLNAEAEEAAEADALSEIMALSAAGDIQAATFAHGAGKVNMAITAALRSDPATTIPLLIRSHQNSMVVVDGARDILQAQVSANIAAGYDSQAFQNAMTNWRTFDATPQGRAARAAYYGQYDQQFMRMSTLVSGGTDTGAAYAQTFGEAGALAGTMRAETAPTGRIKEELEAAATSMTAPNFWQRYAPNFAGRGFTNTARSTINRMVQGGAALRMQNDPNLDAEEAVTNEMSALVADRRLEIVGRDAWANPTRGQTMGELTRVPADRLGAVWDSLVDEGLERVDAQNRPYTVWRQGTGPDTRWIVTTTSQDGESDVFQIDATMITRHDTIREQADIRRRRPSGQPARQSGMGQPRTVDRR